MYKVIHLQGREEGWLYKAGYRAMLQRHSRADGMDADVIGDEFLFNSNGCEIVMQNDTGAVLTHVGAESIIRGRSTG